MSDRVIQSCHDSGKRARQPLHSYQSLWMSRWAGASCNTALQEENQLSSSVGTDEVDHGTKQLHLPSDISNSAKEFREVKTRNFEIINEGPITSSINLRNDTPSSQESPIINFSQKSGSNFVWKNDQEINDTKVLKLQFSQNFEHGNTALRTSRRQFPSPAFCKEKYQKVQNHSGIGLSPSWSSPPETIESETLHRGCCLHTKPSSTHGVKTMGVCTSVDSVEGVSGSRPRIFQTTHSLLITKTTDVNLCKENQIFRELGVLDQLKENSSSELHSFSPLCGHTRRVAKLCEGKENVQDVDAFEVVPKNELSAETDTMDMADFKENHLSGGNSSPSKKDVMVETDSPPNNAITSAGGEVRLKRPIPELPDINIELPALSVEENSMDNADPSISKTQSLDIDLLHAGQPNNAKADHCPGSHLGPEWSSRWIKRLKSSASGSFSIGTKSLNLGETTSHEKVNKFFRRITKGGIPNSDLTLSKCSGKELMVLDQETASIKNGESSSVHNVDNGDDITLSHFWIQRWLHNRATTPQKKAESVVVCDPQISKVTLEDFRKKQFPSIAAMALVGKAMNGFQPCEFQNKGSFIVWNTKSV